MQFFELFFSVYPAMGVALYRGAGLCMARPWGGYRVMAP